MSWSSFCFVLIIYFQLIFFCLKFEYEQLYECFQCIPVCYLISRRITCAIHLPYETFKVSISALHPAHITITRKKAKKNRSQTNLTPINPDPDKGEVKTSPFPLKILVHLSSSQTQCMIQVTHVL